MTADIHDSELQSIIEKAKKGDKEAFAYLYTAYMTPLYRYIYGRVGGGDISALDRKSVAEDLTQDVFVKGYEAFSRYAYSGQSPLAYFYTIARNTVIDYRRKKKIIVADDDAWLSIADDADNPEELAIKAEESVERTKKQTDAMREVREALAFLSEDQQDVIVLRFMNELSTKKIAFLLEKSEEAVRQLQSRGLQALRKILNTNNSLNTIKK